MQAKNSKRMDLSAYKNPKPERVLTDENGAGRASEAHLKPERPKPRPARKPKPIGRPKKSEDEKRDQKITLSLTKAERIAIAEKAGLVPEATFLLNKLRESGVLD